MRNWTVRILLIIAISCFLIGCGLSSRKLPGSWPIKQLTLPQGAVIVEANSPTVFTKMAKTPLSDAWMIYFDCSSTTYAGVVSHVEGCLKQLNYKELWIENPKNGMNTRNSFYNYYSPDGLTNVTIMPGIKGVSGSQSLSFASEYILTIDISDSPDKRLSRAGNAAENGAQIHLEPIK